MAQQVLLGNTEGLVGKDLRQAYSAVGAPNDVTAGMAVRFKKKEEIGTMTKSILKHKIQTLTGRSVKVIEEEMQYKPKDPNEPSMDIDTMRRLAMSLILLSNGVLPAQSNGTKAFNGDGAPEKGKKRANEEEETLSAPQAKAARRTLDSTVTKDAEEEKVVEAVKRKGRRSLAVVPTPASPAVGRVSKRKSLSGSISVASCPSPSPVMKEHLASLEEKEEKEEKDPETIVNPTPLMQDMINKRKSLGPKTPMKSRADTILAKSKEKSKEKPKPQATTPPCPPSPGPRQDFPGKNGAKAFLVAGQPLELRLAKVTKSLPLSSGFPGAHLAVVHTPADWGPHEVYSIADKVKKMNKEAGLSSFVLLVGTGLQNVHMSIEALQRHTKHTQFLTFHRADANLGEETGKLRETCSYFLVAYFFPGSEVESSVVPAKMVRDGFTTCFVTDSTLHLESSIIDCFSEEGEWLLDIACGSRQLSVAALERGRSAVALHAEVDPLEDLGNYLRTISLEVDSTYREKDGIVSKLLA